MNGDDVIPAPPGEDELPPPPSDIAKETKQYGDIKVKKTKPLASVRRAFVIFEKDIGTMAKHGLVSSIVLFVFLALVFYIASFTMEQVIKADIGGGDGGEGDGSGIPKGSGENLPTAHLSVTPGTTFNAGTTVTLDASGSSDDNQITFYVWNFDDGYEEVQLFGETLQYTFRAVGTFDVRLMVVDDEWNHNESMTTVSVSPATSDTQSPNVGPGQNFEINVTDTVVLDGTGATDNVGIVDYTWIFDDGIARELHSATPSYRFDNAGFYNIDLIVRDAAGNTASGVYNVNVHSNPGDTEWPSANANVPSSVNIGDTVELDGSQSQDNQGISSYTWYVQHNGSLLTLNGKQVSFPANEFGPYDVTLIVRDNAGNVNKWEGMTIATPAGMELNKLSWTSTPLGTDISFNLLTYSYGIALLASVIFVGGLFAKGFTHEIAKGTVKVLFFGPISVTTMVFSKILYPLIVGPFLIFPVVAIGLSRFNHPYSEIFMITLVSYAFVALTMVSAAYGSNMLYLAAKKMVIKPSVFSRMFLYLSLIGTLTVFEWMTFLLDNWQSTDSWGNMYTQYSGITVLSPFHQGGVLLSNMLVGTTQTMDLWVFVIPIILIVGGILASKKLYGDIFARE